MSLQVDRVSIPAMSSIGYGYGLDSETGERVAFAGDHRPMYDIGLAIQAAESREELPVVDLEGWQLLGDVDA